MGIRVGPPSSPTPLLLLLLLRPLMLLLRLLPGMAARIECSTACWITQLRPRGVPQSAASSTISLGASGVDSSGVDSSGGERSSSYASDTSRKRCDASVEALTSGWYRLASAKYAFLMSAAEALRLTPSTW